MPRWRTRRSSGAGISYATGLLPSASFSPGEPGSKQRAARGRQRPTLRRTSALLMGAALTQAQSWLAKRRDDLPVIDRDFIDQSSRRERKARSAGTTRAGTRLRAVGRHHRWTDRLDQSVVFEGAFELVHDRAALHARASSARMCSAAEAERALKPGDLSGMRQGLPRDGRGARGGIHDGIAGR